MKIEAEVAVAAPAIGQFTERATDFLSEGGVDARATHHVALILDEILCNLISHAGSGGQTATVRLSIEPSAVRGEIIDSGPPFDLRTTSDPDVTAPIDERPIGGLGLFLIRRLTSTLDYARNDNRNCTTFSVARATSEVAEKS
jgi:anti-sigma regulatory factor (Ser/Thr protein kinase)